ncbi:MAG: acetyl-CoA carboxylase biotin carboxyl carrier protein subunit [Bdellovibrionales bacterium]|nr:acetyl-CoA carboxylase biotin carboxyl carrier protein subunit [Bdellovibrionales bacterium]
MKRYEIEIEGETHKVFAEKVGGTLWYHFKGETYSFVPQTKSRGGAGGGGLVHRSVQAPMPGKIIKVMVKQGEQVLSGQAVLVMEAMKMEYTLEAQVDGPVERVSCQPGDQVSLGQELVYVGEVE